MTYPVSKKTLKASRISRAIKWHARFTNLNVTAIDFTTFYWKKSTYCISKLRFLQKWALLIKWDFTIWLIRRPQSSYLDCESHFKSRGLKKLDKNFCYKQSNFQLLQNEVFKIYAITHGSLITVVRGILVF